jgi:hypothetical protein
MTAGCDHGWVVAATILDESDDGGLPARMSAALGRAAAEFRVSVDDGPVPAYCGWRGKRWGVPVSRGARACWLKLSEQTRALAIPSMWNGSSTAHDTLPPEVSRPPLLGEISWISGDLFYRAELYDRLDPRCTTSIATFLTAAPALDEQWWAGLRGALDGLRTATTNRRAIRARYLEVSMRRQLRYEVSAADVRWSPAHADLHWANVATPQFALVDWERWGMAPAHWDLAMLHVVSLLVPAFAAEIRQRFAPEFADPGTVVAELGVIAWLLDTDSDEDIEALTTAARQRAAELGAR